MIPMQPISNTLKFLLPQDADFSKLRGIHPIEPYCELTTDFLDAWAKRLFANKESRLFPDIMTFAFWIRKGHIRQYLEAYQRQHDENGLRLGRGIVFHIAPSNVPINFAYSLVVGLLAGNANVVRIPSKEFRQITILANELEYLLREKKWAALHDFITLVRYDRASKEWTDYFSSIADVRIIWGGDTTIEDIRTSKLPPRSFDICFADRYSLCVINADELVKEKKLNELVGGFYNDTYFFDQNACTAPHLIVWLGANKNKKEAKQIFWAAVQEYADKQYHLASVMAVDKLVAFCRESMIYKFVKREKTKNNMLVRVHLDKIPDNITECRSLGGYFNEYDADTLDDIAPFITRKFQTLSYYGIKKQETQEFIKNNRLVGIDRCVPIGKTLDFEPVWDGWDLVATLSRIVS